MRKIDFFEARSAANCRLFANPSDEGQAKLDETVTRYRAGEITEAEAIATIEGIQRKVSFHAEAHDDRGRGLPDLIWGWEMPVLADLPSIEAARDWATQVMDKDNRVASVSIRESVQRYPGLPWTSGRHLETIRREDIALDVPVTRHVVVTLPDQSGVWFVRGLRHNDTEAAVVRIEEARAGFADVLWYTVDTLKVIRRAPEPAV
jgi:hypothetical protein